MKIHEENKGSDDANKGSAEENKGSDDANRGSAEENKGSDEAPLPKSEV